MDKQNLYPTIYTKGVGYTENQFTEKITNTLNVVGVSDSYFLGYIPATSLPSTMFPTKATYDSDNDVIIFESCKKNNAEVGYIGTTSNNWISYGFSQTNDNDTFNYNLNIFRYYNNFYPEFASMAEATRIYIRYILYNPLGEFVSFGYSFKTITGSQPYGTYINMWKFLNGETNISYDISGHTFVIGFEDFVSGNGTTFSFAADGYQARIFLVNFWLAGGSTYNGSWAGSTYCYNIKTSGTFQDGTETKLYTFGQRFGADPDTVFCQFYTGNNPGSYGSRRVEKQNTYERGFGLFNNLNISPDDLPSVANTFTFSDGVIAHCTVSNTAYNFYIYITNPNSIKTILGLAFRTNPGKVASYVTNSSYACDVSGIQFAGILKTGDITDEQFKSTLEPWQYVDFNTYDPITNPQGVAENDFTEQDMPDPLPEDEGHNPDNPVLSLANTEDNPDDLIEEDESSDTPINFPISAFMTQYVMRAQDIWDMGTVLWSGIGDPNSDMIANIARVYGSTGTFNIANIMDLFVSVKAFPFNLNDANYTRPVSAMTLGTGAVPLLNRELTVFTASTYMLDCGTVSTNFEAYQLGNSYDYRNYVNCEISCFLPYCGTVELNPSDVFPYTLHCKYFIDMISGSCTACVYAMRGGQELLVGSKNGQIGKIVPITASNVMGIVGTALSDVASAVQTIGQAAISFATRKALGSTQMPINEGAKNVDYLKEVASYKNKQQGIMDNAKNQSDNVDILTGAANGIGNIMTRGGVGTPSLSPGTGLEALMISRRPYITIRRLKYASPNTYGHTTGFYSTDGTSGKSIGSYSGFTQFENVDLTGIYATKEELDEIKMLLENGVYL